MQTTVTKTVKFKSGKTLLPGKEIKVTVISDTIAEVTVLTDGDVYKVKMLDLYRFSDDFVKVTMDMVEEASMDSSMLSITGETGIEPDGHDSLGFPSILLAAGFL